ILSRAGDGPGCLGQWCQTEVAEMRLGFRIEQNVARLDISLQDAVFMRVMNSARELREEFCCVPHWHRISSRNLIERSTFDQLHAEIAGTIARSEERRVG